MEASVVVPDDLDSAVAYPLPVGIQISSFLLMKIILFSSYIFALLLDTVILIESGCEVIVHRDVPIPIEVYFLPLL